VVAAVAIAGGLLLNDRRSDSTDRSSTTDLATTVDTSSVVANAGALPADAGAPSDADDAPATAVAVPSLPAAAPIDNGTESATTEVTPPTIVVGEPARWAEWAVAVPPPLATLTVPTEIVAVSDPNIVHRIEFPSGRVRSLDVAALGPDAQVVVGPDVIAVVAGRDVTMIRDGAPTARVPISDGVVNAQPWPGTTSFIVTTSAVSVSIDEQRWILDASGDLLLLDDGLFADVSYQARFLPSAEIMVNRPGGVYAVAVDQSIRRIGPGDLIANGVSHYAVEECDESLECSQYVIDSTTGTRMPAVLGPVVASAAADPSTRISPDGRYVAFRDYSRGTGVRQIVDVTTGRAIDVSAVDRLVDPDSWAADGSGMFLADDTLRFLVAATGASVALDGFAGISSVITRPPT